MKGCEKSIVNKKVLVVDDEIKIVNILKAYLEKSGYDVLAAYTGNEAIDLFEKNDIALVLLDLMLPDLMGEYVCKSIRGKSRVPIIMITAKTDEKSLIKGLNMGADDYITKPFSPKEVVARVEAVLRRVESDNLVNIPVSFCDGYLTIDFINSSVKINGKEISLTATESKILNTMAKAPNRVFTREELIAYALNYEFEGYDRSIDTYIKSIRLKIEPNRKKPRFIVTVHGSGYKFVGD